MVWFLTFILQGCFLELMYFLKNFLYRGDFEGGKWELLLCMINVCLIICGSVPPGNKNGKTHDRLILICFFQRHFNRC